jgi:hypothetical protein
MTLPDFSSITKRLTVDGLGDLILVDSDATSSSERARNVFLVGNDGKVLWQIEPAVQSHGVIGFSNVYLGGHSELLAYSSNGIEYTVDRATGRILNKELVR